MSILTPRSLTPSTSSYSLPSHTHTPTHTSSHAHVSSFCEPSKAPASLNFSSFEPCWAQGFKLGHSKCSGKKPEPFHQAPHLALWSTFSKIWAQVLVLIIAGFFRLEPLSSSFRPFQLYLSQHFALRVRVTGKVRTVAFSAKMKF